ncbi:hypothetical protein [Eubacterium sp. 1001713B170207_170306_E7]|uniref:hypothetical protein n=1 Tax=Eubacterium sp. 1001713B170207_170306_E7 TaxID=2787097 RepID=UPI00189C20B1|nr:hypothetical protein [Eubacterium sp. 1001713B170207_170306_E7]
MTKKARKILTALVLLLAFGALPVMAASYRVSVSSADITLSIPGGARTQAAETIAADPVPLAGPESGNDEVSGLIMAGLGAVAVASVIALYIIRKASKIE